MFGFGYQKTTIKVDGMSCAHCANAVTKALVALPGIRSAKVDLDAKSVSISRDPAKATDEHIKVAIDEAGYTFVSFEL